VLKTERLLLRPWTATDLPAFAALNADPRVMEHFPALLTRAESDAMAGRMSDHFASHGYGFWAVEVPGVAEFIGFLGLSHPRFEAHFTPCVEIGWRFAHAHWGRGYAPEGAREALRFAFEDLGLRELVAMTTPGNLRSRRVMEKLGMTRSPKDDFEHPLIAPGNPARPHVLYRRGRI
jgi:RimJ/RimL family protein N-acetyltransferase